MFVPVEDWHINELAETMQAIDKESIFQLSGMHPKPALLNSVQASLEANSYLVSGEVVSICGVSKYTLLSDWACPWLLCSDAIRKRPKEFMIQTKKWTYDKLEEHGILRNVVYAKHERSIRWLKWLGFTIYPPEPFGVNNALFCRNELIWAKH